MSKPCGNPFTVGLENGLIHRPMGNEPIAFDLAPANRHKLLHGLDEIGQTLERAGRNDGFEHEQKASFPWLYRAA